MKTSKTLIVLISVVFLLTFVGDVNAQETDPNGNTTYGVGTGISLTTGINNSFFGRRAGYLTTTGNNNTFMGSTAGFKNTSGINNVFLGLSAGFENTTGGHNVFVGVQAGRYNTTASYNTFLGRGAGFSNTTGVSNVFIGYDSGYSNTTATSNTFVGTQSGKLNITGERNVFIGLNAGYSNSSGHRNTYLGMYCGNTNENGNYNVFLGYSAGSGNVNGSGNVFLGYEAGYSETGSNKLYIANGRNASNLLIYGDFSGRKVGILNSSPYYQLDVAGEVGAYRYWVTSDSRLKENIEPIRTALDKISDLRGVQFNWKNKAANNNRQVGLIAQEVEKVYPELVSTDKNGYKSVSYSNLVAPLIEAVKELKAENESLKKRIEALEKK